MSHKVLRSLRIALPVLGVGLLIGTGAASGSTRSKSASLGGNGAAASVTATCKHGEKATGGGFRTTPPIGLGGASDAVDVVYESRKVGQRSWRVSAQENAGGPYMNTPTTVTAFAYCGDGPKTRARWQTGTGASGSLISADATCHSGKAQAGGFSTTPISGPGYAYITDSARSGKKTWHSRAVSGGGVVTSYVYCASEKLANRSGNTTSSGSPVTGTAISDKCKSGTKALAGGFSQPNAFSGGGISGVWYLPFEFVRSGKAWRTSAVHQAPPSTPTTLTSIAYCG
jgi:hypothetical protein